jgi:hypothetical protein
MGRGFKIFYNKSWGIWAEASKYFNKSFSTKIHYGKKKQNKTGRALE